MNEEENRKKLTEELKHCRSQMNQIDSGQEKFTRKQRYAELGLCSQCDHLHAETTQYGSKHYWCTVNSRRYRVLSSTDPLVDCTNFWATGQLNLSTMFSIAHTINIKKKRPVGFVTEEEADKVLYDMVDPDEEEELIEQMESED